MIPTSAPTVAVTACDLSVAYGDNLALERANFAVHAGTTMAVIGPNGSGKSTLLRAIAGLATPLAGRLDVAERNRRGGVAFVLQATEVDRSLPISVREAVQMARYPSVGLLGRLRREDRERVVDALERLELGSLASRQLHELSGGQRQRVLVAQGLAQGAELLLLDEPFTGLDIVSKQRIVEVIDAERAAGHTVVFSTHDLDDAGRADAVLLLAGRQVAFGPPSEVLVGDSLAEAYGGRMLRLDDGTIVVDDPHHGDGHGHHH